MNLSFINSEVFRMIQRYGLRNILLRIPTTFYSMATKQITSQLRCFKVTPLLRSKSESLVVN
jgi:hypothetical protein